MEQLGLLVQAASKRNSFRDFRLYMRLGSPFVCLFERSPSIYLSIYISIYLVDGVLVIAFYL